MANDHHPTTAAEAYLAALKTRGVEWIFGNAGTDFAPLIEAAAAGAVSDALMAGLPALERGRVITLNFLKARARREEAGQIRRIDLTFRARVHDD